ncbi:MAG: ABC transporter permease [Bacteroidota bacterium]
MNIPFFIAKRYLVSKKSNNAINIISWISISAIAIATAALLIILSFMNGLTGMVKDLYNSFNPDLVILPAKGKTFTPDSIKLVRLSKVAGVTCLNYSIEENALLKYGDKQAFATVKAVGSNFFSVTGMDKRVEYGPAILKGLDGNYIIAGKGLVYELGVVIQNKLMPIMLYAPKRGNVARFTVEDALNEEALLPTALFSINDEFDFKYVIVDLNVGRSLFGYEKEITSIDIAINPAANPNKVKTDLMKIFGEDYLIKDRFEQNKVLFTTLQTEKLAVFLVLIFVLIVATFNIIGSLIMLIAEKKKDLVTLNNMGAGISLIRKIFVYEGLMIVFSGAVAGLFLGLLICLIQKNFEIITMNGLGREIPYPVEIIWSDFALILVGVFFIGVIAIMFPVRIFTKKSVMEKFRTAY